MTEKKNVKTAAFLYMVLSLLPRSVLQGFLSLGCASGLSGSIAAGGSAFPEFSTFHGAFMLYGG